MQVAKGHANAFKLALALDAAPALGTDVEGNGVQDILVKVVFAGNKSVSTDLHDSGGFGAAWVSYLTRPMCSSCMMFSSAFLFRS